MTGTCLITETKLFQLVCHGCGHSEFAVVRNFLSPLDYIECKCGRSLKMNGAVLSTEN